LLGKLLIDLTTVAQNTAFCQNKRLQSEDTTISFSAQYVYGSLFPMRPPRFGVCRGLVDATGKVWVSMLCVGRALSRSPTIRKPLALDRTVVILGDALSNDVSFFLVPTE